MATPVVTYSFTPATLIESAKVNQNFDDLVSFLQTDTVHVDASNAFTAVPSGPATNPSSDNQLTRKKYVDDADSVVAKVRSKWVGAVPLSGTFTLGTSQPLIQAGFGAVSLDGTARATINLPSAFPNGIIAVLAIRSGDGQVGGPVEVITEGFTLSSFRVYMPGASTSGQGVAWLALGF